MRRHADLRTSGFTTHLAAALVATLAAWTGCAAEHDGRRVVSLPGSAVGAEAEILRDQLERFMSEHPDIEVVQRITPDSADQRRQLYVQWLNAGAADPDVLQLDVVWTPEFAAAGWILPLETFGADPEDFFPATLEANTWRGALYAMPWFVDVGMLYWRTDLMETPPATFEELAGQAARLREAHGLPYGLVWQGARYEGLVTVFLEYLTGFGGEILDAEGRVAVDSPAALRALREMQTSVAVGGMVPRDALGWQEEQTRFAFQAGKAAFMRNWPYAYPLMQNAEDSRVSGRFAVAPMPAAAGGRPGAALGGSQLAINRHSDEPEAAWAVIDFLTRPEQMRERARRAGQYPARRSLFEDGTLTGVLPVPPGEARRIIAQAVPRPVTPVYAELSGLLQIHLHRALSGQQEPEQALSDAAGALRALLARAELTPGPWDLDGP